MNAKKISPTMGLPMADGVRIEISKFYTILIMDMNTRETVAELKNKISEIKGIPTYLFTLIMGGNVFEDNRWLDDYNVSPTNNRFGLIHTEGKKPNKTGDETITIEIQPETGDLFTIEHIGWFEDIKSLKDRICTTKAIEPSRHHLSR